MMRFGLSLNLHLCLAVMGFVFPSFAESEGVFDRVVADLRLAETDCDRVQSDLGTPFLKHDHRGESTLVYLSRSAIWQNVLHSHHTGEHPSTSAHLEDLGGKTRQLVLYFDESCRLKDFLYFSNAAQH